MRKLDFCLCENKSADQLCSNCEAEQRLCFCYTDSTIPLLPKSKIASIKTSACVKPGGRAGRSVFSCCGSSCSESFKNPPKKVF